MQAQNTTNILSNLTDYKIIPVIRADSPKYAHQAVTTLANVGFRTAEITMTVPGAVDLIKDFSQHNKDLLVGAGTIFGVKEAEDCILAGAKYIVSPYIADGVSELCNEAGIPCIMSGLTPTEISEAWKRGSAAVKVFPAKSMGGPSHLKALKTIFPTVPLVPTGGVNLSNIKEYLDSGASFVGVGSDLVNIKLLEQGKVDAVAELGRQYLSEVNKIQ